MAEKMLIDASHAEETRVVVVRGNRIEEFDFESEHKKQIRGNIYLAKVTRVEPSLQAAFVDYGGNRHGFLAFAEIHPDYYQIPLADRQALLRAEAEEARRDDDIEHVETGTDLDSDDDASDDETAGAADDLSPATAVEAVASEAEAPVETLAVTSSPDMADGAAAEAVEGGAASEISEEAAAVEEAPKAKPKRARRSKKTVAAEAAEAEASAATADDTTPDDTATDDSAAGETDEGRGPNGEMAAMVDTDTISEAPSRRRGHDDDDDDGHHEEKEVIESVGAEDAMEEVPDRKDRRPRKQYRIQEVIKRRQILLVQVAKEERGNKGAALTTYLSLAGRYSVLMPNTARGGGISRKITNLPDRKRLKEIARALDVPQGMGVILRTAGANRTKVEVKRDFEYLMRLWENVRTLTLASTAPCLVYEEGSLIKRSIRDLYNKDISEIVVSGEEGYREAKAFMKMLMPSHAKVVQPYRDVHPIFSRSGIEAQLDRMLQPQVTLKSGGYIIINQTEALVAIDVNSGRSTREHSIEDTALQTNLEAAEEVARQLRLRDLAGLVVVDFIDMEEKRNNRAVEKRLKDHLKNDRARIQVGRISHFGLLEMSRQRIRASVLESTTQVCPHCAGTGHVRSQSSIALHVLRGVEEYLLKNTTHDITVRATPDIALYLLNYKRSTITDYEARFGVAIVVEADAHVGALHFAIDRGEAVENPVKIEQILQFEAPIEDEDDDVIIEDDIEDDEELLIEAKPERAERPDRAERENGDDQNGRKRKRRRRRRGGRDGDADTSADAASSDVASDDDADEGDDEDEADDAVSADQTEGASGEDRQKRKRRRRGKRGGRRNKDGEIEAGSDEAAAADAGDAGAAGADSLSQADAVDNADASEETAVEGQVVAAQADNLAGDAVAETEDRAPAPKRSRRRRSPQDLVTDVAVQPEAAGDAVSTDDAAQAAVEATPDAVVSEQAPASEEARTEEASASLGESDEAHVAVDTAGESPSVAEPETSDDKPARNNRNIETIASEPLVRSSAASPDETTEEAKPKKGGWWQKRGFL
ncbi:ribonuclease [Rhizobium sp. Leaf384]|uniref:Rne/Rng family ribonuclease n=1 Tax=unclassified Rhizobium TaxID=2613769 RepID=UPI000714141A|nr:MULTISPECIES: ribonuclease E/G [unclassified Rhizobium]KQS74096.1 ribonuclease [Rhizobium sp. Leaf383]KQS80291.1 ribonuclease [Rhizobium sp. Leaf384]